MPKISVSIPDEILEFLDKQGKNRSKTIVTILEDYKKKKFDEQLAKDYEEYEEFSKEDDKDFWQDWEKSALEDLSKEYDNE